MGRIFLTYVGQLDELNGTGFIPGVPASDLELDDGEDSEDRYAAQIAENTQYAPPVLITRRGIERRIVWGAEEDRDVPLAERLASQLTAGGLYARQGGAPGPVTTTTEGAEGASTGGEAAGEAE